MKSDRAVRAERRRIWWASLSQVTRMLILIGILAILIMGFFAIKNWLFSDKKPEITTEYITGKLDVASELNTAELTYTGMVKFEDGSIPFLTKKTFSMIYTASVKAGIDFSKIKVDVKDNSVIVTLPEAQVQSVYVDPKSIEFYDEGFALFNWSSKKDITDSIAMAESDIQNRTEDMNNLLKKSEEQTERRIRALLEDAIGDKQLIIKSEKKTQ